MKYLIALILISVCLPLAGYRVNLTHSLPIGVYRITHDPVKRGSLAAFCLEDPRYIDLARVRDYLAVGSCPSGLRPLLKEVMGLPGDVIGLRDTLITLNGQSIAGTALLKPGVIPPGKALVLSLNPSSFDSRYFGLVPLTNLNSVDPIFTF
jgi:conjugative transfer signal peptidase TraF